MIKRLLIILLLITPVALAQTENYNDRTSLTISYESDGKINLQGSIGFDYFKAILYLLPKDSERQEILSLTTSPTAYVNDAATFTWNNFQETLNFHLDSEIKTTNQIYLVDRESFPIRDLDQEYEEYLDAEEIIDITPEIVDKASEIIGGETDLYTAVFKIAEWVNKEIDYDLNTLTADAAQKSSWVLQNREGVCDEMTSLFISLLRSVGIPARFVSGTAYSNLNYNFENHGWAEVYFPDQGWVPYDVTFTQFGWIDPGHLELSKSLDAGQTSVKYTWKSKNTEIVSSELTNEPKVLSQGNKIEPPFNLEIRTLVDEVGPGSYVPMQVIVENPYDKFTANTITITKAPSKIEDNQKPVLLKPSNEKSIFWIVRVPSDLNPGFIYTSEIEAKDLFGKKAENTLRFGSGYETISEEYALNLIEELEDKEEKKYSEEIALNCEPEKNYYYDFEEINVKCEVKNTGNVLLKNVPICLEEDCRNKDLKIGIKEEIVFENVPQESKMIATVVKDNIDLVQEINIKILEEPDLLITGFQSPAEVNYGEDFNLSFVLSSDAIVKDVVLKIKGLEPLEIEKKQKAQTITIKTNSKNFITELIKMRINYKDEYDREFEIEKLADMKVNNLPWYIKILAFFQRLV